MELKPFICASEVLLITITIWGINIASKFWTDISKVIIKLVLQHSWICYWYFIYFPRCRRFFPRFSRSKFIDSLPGLFRIARILVKTILIIGLLSLFTILRCFLITDQSFESFDLLALIFRISRSCIRFFTIENTQLVHGISTWNKHCFKAHRLLFLVLKNFWRHSIRAPSRDQNLKGILTPRELVKQTSSYASKNSLLENIVSSTFEPFSEF